VRAFVVVGAGVRVAPGARSELRIAARDGCGSPRYCARVSSFIARDASMLMTLGSSTRSIARAACAQPTVEA